jgi:hypothetical protein
VDDELISRDELTATLFAINDIYIEVRKIRRLLEEEADGEEAPGRRRLRKRLSWISVPESSGSSSIEG